MPDHTDLPPTPSPSSDQPAEPRVLGRPARPPIPEALVHIPPQPAPEVALADAALSTVAEAEPAPVQGGQLGAVAGPAVKRPAWLPVGLGIAVLAGLLGAGGLLLTQRAPQQTGVVIPSGGDGQTISGAAVPAGKLGAPTQPEHDSPPIQQPPKPVPVRRAAPTTNTTAANSATNTVNSAVDTAPVQTSPVTPVNNTYTAPAPVQHAQTPVATPPAATPETTEPPNIDTTPIATPEANANASTNTSSPSGQATITAPTNSAATATSGATSNPIPSPLATNTAPAQASASTNAGQPATDAVTAPQKTPEKPATTNSQPQTIQPAGSMPVEIPATPLTLPESAPAPADTGGQSDTGQSDSQTTGQLSTNSAAAQGALNQ